MRSQDSKHHTHLSPPQFCQHHIPTHIICSSQNPSSPVELLPILYSRNIYHACSVWSLCGFFGSVRARSHRNNIMLLDAAALSLRFTLKLSPERGDSLSAPSSNKRNSPLFTLFLSIFLRVGIGLLQPLIKPVPPIIITYLKHISTFISSLLPPDIWSVFAPSLPASL